VGESFVLSSGSTILKNEPENHIARMAPRHPRNNRVFCYRDARYWRRALYAACSAIAYLRPLDAL